MNKTKELEKVEANCCKLTGGLVHKDCPDDCTETEKKEINKNRIPKEYKLKIPRDNLYVYWVWKSISKSEEGIYDIEEIKELLNKCKFVSKKFSIDPNPEDKGSSFREDPYPEEKYEKIHQVSERHNIMELRKCLNKIDGYKKKGVFIPQIELKLKSVKLKPISDIEAYPPSEEFFGSDIIFRNLKRKIEDLIARNIDQNNEILKRLRGKKKVKPEELDLYRDLWNWIEKDKEFIKQKRKIDESLNEHTLLKRKERNKPLNFGLTHVLAAWEKEIIDKREAQILRFRYFGGQGTNSLREVAKLLEISHPMVKNIEIKALKKMEAHIKEIKKIVCEKNTKDGI